MISETKPRQEEFEPYIPAEKSVPEFTLRSILLGSVLGIVFGAANAYLGMKIGMTISASIPAAVMSMAILRGLLKKGTILENNIVQTIASSGEALAAGVIFTIPGFLILRHLLRWDGVPESQLPQLPSIALVFLMTLIGGFIGALMMIPLRRYLIVKEHKTLPFPEGTACACVLEAGETGGLQAQHVFRGIGIGSLYMFLMKGLRLWKDEAMWFIPGFKKGAIGLEPSAALLGVGFIIGPKIAVCMFAGGVIGWLVLIPLFGMIGSFDPDLIIPPATKPLSELGSWQIASSYIRYIGAGAVALGGIVSLIKALPIIASSFTHSIKGLRLRLGQKGALQEPRTDRDMPMTFVFGSSLILAVSIGIILYVVATKVGMIKALPLSVVGGFVAILFSFFFITVAARIVGIVGSSSSPVSGMTITSLLAVCLTLVGCGLVTPETSVAAMVVALAAGAMICIAVCSSGDISQDLKTGFLVGATPYKQQIAELVAVIVPAIAIVGTVYLLLLRGAGLNTLPVYEGKVDFRSDAIIEVTENALVFDSPKYGKIPVGLNVIHFSDGTSLKGKIFLKGRDPQRGEWITLRSIDGKIIEFHANDYTRVDSYEDKMGELRAPQANIMAILIKGIIDGKLPWVLVFVGVMLATVVELLGIGSLPFAIGLYLGIATNATILVGGIVYWLCSKLMKENQWKETQDKGCLIASGIIAGDALMGIALAFLAMAGALDKLGLREITERHWEDALTVIVFTALTLLFSALLWRRANGARS